MAEDAVGDTGNTITFATKGDWRAHEVTQVLSSVEVMYDALLVASIASRVGGQLALEHETLGASYGIEESEAINVSAGERVEAGAAIVFPLGGTLFGPAGSFARSGRGITASEELLFTPTFEPFGSRRWVTPTLSARLGGPVEAQVSIIAAPVPDIKFIEDNLEVLAPGGRLAVARIQMASPGIISLRGLGEPVEALRRLIKTLATLPGAKRKARNANREKEEEIRHMKEMNELEESAARVKTVVDAFSAVYGENFREMPDVMAQMQRVLVGAADLGVLTATGRLQLKAA